MAIKYNPITGDKWDEILKFFPKYHEGMVRSEPGLFTMPTAFAEISEDLNTFPFDPTDVIIHGVPKSGTTWIQDMVWVLQHDMDLEGVKKFGGRVLVPEFWALPSTEEREKYIKGIEQMAPGASMKSQFAMKPKEVAQIPPPRLFKTHVPFFILNPKTLDTCKVIYVARNPKDNCVSYYHHHRNVSYNEYTGDFEKFAEFYMNGDLQYFPYWAHVKEAWELSKHHPNLLFLTYEDLKKDLKSGIRKIADHMGKKTPDSDIDKIHDYFTIKNFKDKAAIGDSALKKIGFFNEGSKFVRKGVSGDWQNHFSQELNVKFDAWIQQNSKDTDLIFDYGKIE